MPVYEKCKVFTCNHACNLPVIIDSVDDKGNNLDSSRISLKSFWSFRGPLLYKLVTGQELSFAISYSKPALVKSSNNQNESNGGIIAFRVYPVLYTLIEYGGRNKTKIIIKPPHKLKTPKPTWVS